MVLSETHNRLRRCGLTLLLVIRGGLWLGECLDVTARAGQNVPAETHPRTFVSDLEITEWSPVLVDRQLIRAAYVTCIVSFFGSQSSPFFHRRRATDTILRASVTFASSSLTPRAREA